MDELAKHRWNKIDRPSMHEPRTAIMAALDKYDELPVEKRPDHVIVVFGRNCEDGSDGTTFFQAGKFTHYSMMGLMLEAREMIRES